MLHFGFSNLCREVECWPLSRNTEAIIPEYSEKNLSKQRWGMCAWHVGEGRVQTWLCQMAGNQSYVCTWHVERGWCSKPVCLCQMAGNQSDVYIVCGGGYGPNLIVSNGWKSTLWEGYSPILIASNGWKSILRVCTACGGGYGPILIVSNGWKSILCVHCKWGRVPSKPDCGKLLEINPVCVHGM